MQEFVIVPFIGAIPIQFGMTPAKLGALLGPPSWTFYDSTGKLIEERVDLHVNVGYRANGELDEAVFARGAVLKYEEQNLLESSDPVSILRRYNMGYKWFGSVVFPSIGVMYTAIEHDDGEPEWTITVAVKGKWDEYKERFAVLP